MATLIDIVDTTIKVGLGAAISALASFAVGVRNRRHDFVKLRASERVQLIRDAVLSIERAGNTINDALVLQQVWRRSQGGSVQVSPQETASSIASAFNKLREAHSLLLLAGEGKLASLLSEYLDEVHVLYLVHMESTQGPDSDTLKACYDKRKAVKDKWLNELPSVLSRLTFDL